MDRDKSKEQLLLQISELRKQVESLSLSCRALGEKANLLDHSCDCIIVRDLEDRIISWNPGAESHYGWKEKEAVGKFSNELLQTRFPATPEEIAAQFEAHNWWEGELMRQTREGADKVVASRWVPLRNLDGSVKAILEINNDITARKGMEVELEEKSNRLQEVNAALKVLLRQRDDDRKDLEEAIAINLENLILPYLKRLKASPLSSTQKAIMEVLESHLRELTSKFTRNISMEFRSLTPTEMRVATLVREGKTTKEIADLLCMSDKTASFHRENVRSKLGIRGKRVNLRSHLLTLPY